MISATVNECPATPDPDAGTVPAADPKDPLPTDSPEESGIPTKEPSPDSTELPIEEPDPVDPQVEEPPR